MKILVTCKRVPNPEQKLKISGGKIDLASASWQLNTFDEYAVETALRLTEKGKGGERSGEVVAVSIGPKDVQQQLRGVLAMGADRAILVAGDDAALDAWAVARVAQGGGRAREARPGRPRASRRSTAIRTRSGRSWRGCSAGRRRRFWPACGWRPTARARR